MMMRHIMTFLSNGWNIWYSKIYQVSLLRKLLPQVPSLLCIRNFKHQQTPQIEAYLPPWIHCIIDYKTYVTDVEDGPADDDDVCSDDNEVNDGAHGNDKKDEDDGAYDAAFILQASSEHP